MEIIPVIDLRDEMVVHARMGRRELYRPIQTPLSPTSKPVDVVTGLMSIHPFATLYIADLDAIEGKRNNHLSIMRLKQTFPQVAFWLDSGIADVETAMKWLRLDLGHLVLGSEAQFDADILSCISENDRLVLSLDFREARFQGPATLLTQVNFWPRRVIVMTLDRVGSHSGPDFERLGAIKRVAETRAIYAAGGVRNAEDLQSLADLGIAGALVASSLHTGSITAADIRESTAQGANGGSSLL